MQADLSTFFVSCSCIKRKKEREKKKAWKNNHKASEIKKSVRRLIFIPVSAVLKTPV